MVLVVGNEGGRHGHGDGAFGCVDGEIKEATDERVR